MISADTNQWEKYKKLNQLFPATNVGFALEIDFDGKMDFCIFDKRGKK